VGRPEKELKEIDCQPYFNLNQLSFLKRPALSLAYSPWKEKGQESSRWPLQSALQTLAPDPYRGVVGLGVPF